MKLTQDGKWKRVDYFTGKKPETSGVYALVVNKDILYIGSTCNFKQRLAYHEVVRRICDDKNISDGITVFMRETRDYRKIEIELIKTYSPDYNTAWTARRLENKPKKKRYHQGKKPKTWIDTRHLIKSIPLRILNASRMVNCPRSRRRFASI